MLSNTQNILNSYLISVIYIWACKLCLLIPPRNSISVACMWLSPFFLPQPSHKWHNITFQKIYIFISIAARTSNPITVVLHMVEAAGFASPHQCSLHSQGTDYGNEFQACKTAGKCQWGTLRTNNTHSPLPRYKFKIWCSTHSHLEVETECRQKVYTSGMDSQTSVQQKPFVINMYKWPQAC